MLYAAAGHRCSIQNTIMLLYNANWIWIIYQPFKDKLNNLSSFTKLSMIIEG